MPRDDDLGRRRTVLLGDPPDDRVVEHPLARGQGTPRLGDDAVLGVELPQRDLLEVRVQLDLVDARRLPGLVEEPLEVGGVEVAHADGAHAALVAQLAQRLPGLDVAVLPGRRPVDEEQVEHVEPEPLQRGVERGEGGVSTVVVVPDLRRDEHVLAGHVARRQGPADALLVAVEARRVDVPVAGLQGGGHGRLDLVVGHLPDAEADARDRHGAGRGGQKRGGHGGHPSTVCRAGAEEPRRALSPRAGDPSSSASHRGRAPSTTSGTGAPYR